MNTFILHLYKLDITTPELCIPDSEARRKQPLGRSPGFLYSYIRVYRKSLPTEPSGSCEVKLRIDTMRYKGVIVWTCYSVIRRRGKIMVITCSVNGAKNLLQNAPRQRLS